MSSVKICKDKSRPAHDIKFYTVTFEQNNGLNPIVKICPEGESVAFPANPIVPGGYQFKGWALKNDELTDILPGSSYLPRKSLTIYAIYIAPITTTIYWKVDTAVNTLHLSADYEADYNSWAVADEIPPWTSAYGRPQITDPSGVMFDTPMAPQYCSYWFCNMPHLSTLTKFDNLKMYYCESISNMFHYCAIMPNIDLSNWKTPKLKTMYQAFARCKRMTLIELSFLDFSQVENMENLCLADAELQYLNIQIPNPATSLKLISGLVNNCPKLKVLDLSFLKTNNLISAASAFRDCVALTGVKLTNLNTYKLANMNSMFNGDVALEHIYVDDGWTTDAVTASVDMFKNCSKLPNFDPAKTDKTHAKIGEYLEKGD